jgi:hypothetical protein
MVAYSDKGYGMTRYAYGDEQWVVGLQELTNPTALVQKVSEILKNKNSITKFLKDNREQWKNDARLASNTLKQIYVTKKHS